MARKTITQLEAALAEANIRTDRIANELIEAQRSIKELEKSNSSKDQEIYKLRRHVGFVHAQRDRLVGFIEGLESMINPTVDVPSTDYYQPHSTPVDRVQKFLNECTLQFIDPEGPTVRNDEMRFRSM